MEEPELKPPQRHIDIHRDIPVRIFSAQVRSHRVGEHRLALGHRACAEVLEHGLNQARMRRDLVAELRERDVGIRIGRIEALVYRSLVQKELTKLSIGTREIQALEM